MSRFFSDNIVDNIIEISEQDSKHISKVLRMSIGDKITVCDLKGNDYLCTIKSINPSKVIVEVNEKRLSATEPNVDITLYQSLPKGDKFDLIIQKSVEIGVNKIVPIITNRCIPKLDKRTQDKKILRYQKVSLEASKQSNRAKIPIISPFVSYNEALNEMKNKDVAILFYEKENTTLNKILSNIHNAPKNISIMIGPEGGFDEFEIKIARSLCISIASMGKRILRCETASIYSLSVLIFKFDI